MISGIVRGREARIRLPVRGPGGIEQEVDAVIGTGYTAWLTLPPSLVSSLGLMWQSVDRGQLADGSETLFDVYDAIVLWDGQPRHVLVAESSTVPMVGMAMLSGFELRVQVRTGGSVVIEALDGP